MRYRLDTIVVLVALLAAWSVALAAPAATGLYRTADSYSRSALTDPASESRVKSARNLSGGGCCVSGWFEYDFDIRNNGWYRLIIHGSTNGVEFLVDPDRAGRTAPEGRFLSGSGQNLATDKVGNVWLSSGLHRIRLQRYYWTGFPGITAVELQPGSASLADSIAIATPEEGRSYRKGQCPEVEILAGGLQHEETLRIAETDPYSFVKYRWHSLKIPAAPTPTRLRFALPCSEEGFRILWFADSRKDIRNEELRGFFYEIVDTRARPESGRRESSIPILDIDCAAREPDYSGGGPTRVVRRSYAAYRESGDRGWTGFQRAPEVARRALPEPSWFAYTLRGLSTQRRYQIAVDYPDDAWRTFGVALRESAPLSYPVATAVDTGGEHRLSHASQTLTMVTWPRALDPRLTFMTAHEGSRAACSRIRVSHVEPPGRIILTDPNDSRRFLNWQEEGGNFASMFGPVDDGPRGTAQAVDRWAQAASAVGASTLMPTVAVYSFALYPSQFNQSFSDPGQDTLRRLLLAAEKHDLNVVPELHPRADELSWGRANPAAVPDDLLVSKEGRNNFFGGDGKTRNFPPHFNPLAPRIQDWYVGMVGELADRYKDSPAFEGISLRFMQWANPALNNLVSLDWGYDDATVARFVKETGSALPATRTDDPQRFAARHAWLTGPAREAWTQWRAHKIADLVRRVRDRVRQARPDLRIYISVFDGGTAAAAKMREAGLDPALLNEIEGVILLNATFAYGRREPDALRNGYRDTLQDAIALGVPATQGAGGAFLSSARYLEATEAIIPPDRIGFPAATKKTWTSMAANPPGRLALERYAIELAETDARILGDGGNAYSFGPPVVREFMDTFRRLPARSFADRADATDPVAVRTLVADEAFLFYAVNRERYPVKVDIALGGARNPARVADGKVLTLRDGHLLLELKPYELVGVRTEPGARITAVRTRTPVEETLRLDRQIARVERLGRISAVARLLSVRLAEQDFRTLQDAAADARKAFAAGHYWRARARLEQASLLRVFHKLGCHPKGLLDGDPAAADCED